MLIGSFDLRFDHQKSEGALKQAADSGCPFCGRVWQDLVQSEHGVVSFAPACAESTGTSERLIGLGCEHAVLAKNARLVLERLSIGDQATARTVPSDVQID